MLSSKTVGIPCHSHKISLYDLFHRRPMTQLASGKGLNLLVRDVQSGCSQMFLKVQATFSRLKEVIEMS